MSGGGIVILRVISGMAKGHKLKTVKGNTTRPTSDRVKESLFNIIAPYIPDADVLDLFAGTGNLAIEALSRGAKSAVLSDKSSECTAIIKENLNHTKLSEKALVLTGEAEDILHRLVREGKKFDIIFLDPPYSRNLVDGALNSIVKHDLIKTDSIIIAERDTKDILPREVGGLKLVRDQKYGDTAISIYRVILEENEGR